MTMARLSIIGLTWNFEFAMRDWAVALGSPTICEVAPCREFLLRPMFEKLGVAF